MKCGNFLFSSILLLQTVFVTESRVVYLATRAAAETKIFSFLSLSC